MAVVQSTGRGSTEEIEMSADSELCGACTRVEVLLGHDIEEPTELRFLQRLRADLESSGEPALVLGNFYCGLRRTQVDFVVVTTRGATVIEIKGYRLPVEGGVNGQWVSLFPGGARRKIVSKNPFQQALDARYAVADALAKIATVDSVSAKRAVGGSLCLFPEPLVGSNIPESNFKCTVGGYRQLLSQIQGAREGAISLDTWREFASQIGLTPHSDVCHSEWESFAAEYNSQWQATTAATSRPFVPLPLLMDERAASLAECVQQLHEGNNLLVVGPSGSGKSRVLEELSTLVGSACMLPISVEARVFCGNLRPLLERSVSLATNYALADVLRCSRRSANAAVVLVDGFNECPSEHRQALIRTLFALHRRYGVRVVVSSQNEMPVPWLPSTAAKLPALSSSHLRAVLESHLGRSIVEIEEHALEVVATAHDAEILASVIGNLVHLDGRFSLYAAFTRQVLGCQAPAGHRALARLAARMRERFLSSLSEHELLRELAALLESETTATQVWESARDSGVMVVRSGRAFFRHDLIGDYFSTVSLLAQCTDIGAKVLALDRPINAPLLEFAVGACETLSDVGMLLQSASPELLIACMDGKCGAKPRSYVLDRVRDMLDVVVSDYLRLIAELVTDEEGRHHVSVRLPGDEEAPSYGNFMAIVPCALGHGLLPDVLRTFGLVDRKIWNEAERLRAQHPDVNVAFRRRTYNAFYSSPGDLLVRAMRDIQEGLSFVYRRSAPLALTAALWDKLSNPAELSPGQLLVVTAIVGRLDSQPNSIPVNFAMVVQHLWDTGIQQLRFEVVQLTRRTGRLLNAEQQGELRDTISSWFSETDFFTNSMVFDALQGIGGPETCLSVESAHEEFLELLSMQQSEPACERAMHMYVCTFDHPCEELYAEAFNERLTNGERQELLLRAAAARYGDMTTPMVIAELARCPVPAAIQCFKKFAQAPKMGGAWVESAVETYLRSIKALAEMGVPFEFADGIVAGTSAWSQAAPLLHLLCSRLGDPEGKQLAFLWEQLESCGVGRAFDVVMRTETSFMFHEKDTKISFVPACNDGVRRMARAVLSSDYQSETEFERLSQWHDVTSAHRVFALQVLGNIGRKTDIELVRVWTEDATLGPHAIAAARALESPTWDMDIGDAH